MSHSQYFNSSNIDVGSVDGLFHIANVGSGSHFGDHDHGNPEEEEEAHELMPGYWHWRTAGRAGASGVGLLGRIHEARHPRAPSRTSSALDLSSDSDDDFGFAARSVQSSGSSELWDRMEAERDIAEAKSKRRSGQIAAREDETQQRRATRRAVRARRCAGFLTMAALSASAWYFIAEQGLSPTLQMRTVANFLDRLFGGGDKLNEAEGVRQLRYRRLPQGAQQETAAAAQEDSASRGASTALTNKGIFLYEMNRREHLARMNED